MGFGYLLVGYILSFVFTLGKVYFFQDIIGALVMMVGLSKLALHQNNFLRAMWCDIGYLMISTVRVFLMMFKLLESEGLLSTVFAVLIPMCTGPYIGSFVIGLTGAGATYEDLGTVKQVPTPWIFLAAAAVLLLVLIPIHLLKRRNNHA